VYPGTVVETMPPPSIYNNEYGGGEPAAAPHWARPVSENPGYQPGAPVTNAWFPDSQNQQPVRPTENHPSRQHPAQFSQAGDGCAL
jgi:hypothetical protein